MIKQVIFDLDGTLLDTREGILESVRCAAHALGYGELSHETLLTFVGPPLRQSFMTHYGCTPEGAQRAVKIFRDCYGQGALLKAQPYEGIYELCGELKRRGISMAVATYKPEDFALPLLRHFRFDEYCGVMHGADRENKLSKRDIIELCMEEMGAAQQETILVGDTEHDAAGAAEAGIAFLAVTYGFGFRSREDVRRYPCLGVARTPMEIADILSLG